MKWTEQNLAETLKGRGWYQSQRAIEHAIQFELLDGTRVNLYHTGRVQVQGKNTDIKRAAQALLADASKSGLPVPAAPPSNVGEDTPNRVFIVYGHDVHAREQLELLLRRLKLDPIVLQSMAGGGDTIIEKLEKLTDADFACVLVTPDDEGRKRANDDSDDNGNLRPRARQNVVLELGMVLARLGRRRVAILLKGEGIERPSDIDGLLYIAFSNHVDEIKNDLAANLQTAGFSIQVKDLLAGPS